MSKTTITIVISVLFLAMIIGTMFLVNKTQQKNITNETSEEVKSKTNPGSCVADEDCVPATCCHPTQVVNKQFAPNCRAIMCTMSCETVLDCGRGMPVCNNGTCEVKKILRNEQKRVF